MPDYLDALFEKAKAKKDAKQPGKPEDAAQKKAVKPEPAKKNPAQIQQAQGKKPWHTEPKPLPGKKNLILEQMRSEEPEKAQSEDKEDEEKKAAKEVMLAKQKIAEIKSTLPPQENINAPQNPESVPEEQKSTAERELETSEKKLIDSYGNAKIYELPGQPLLYYWIPVPRPVGAEKTIINTIKEAATRVISITPYKIRDPEQRKNVYYQKVLEILRDSPELNIPKTRFDFYANTVIREMIGYGIIDDLIHDDKLEEIMVIAPNRPVYIFHRKYGMMITNIEFYNDNEIQDLVNRIARQIGRRVDISSPLLDARLPDGSRVNATIPPASVQGSTLTIRKFREDPYTIIDLIKNKTIEAETAAFLWACTDGLGTKPANILISGGTGSGKTTTLNVLATFIPETERIISIEDTAELNLPLKHWIRMEARPPGLEGTGEVTLDILTKNSLRMRPDRIIVGEIRHDEAFSLFTAFNTGHDGCLTGEAKIALTSGIREIGQFTEEQLQKNGSRKEGEWEVCTVGDEHINSVDGKGKVNRQKIVQARRRPFTGNVYHIKLASGSELTCTGNHPFYTLADNIQQARADTLKEGQNIATPRKLLREENAKETESEYWSGLLHGDGNITYYKRQRKKNGKQYLCNEGSINLYTEEETIIPKFINYMKENLDGTHVKIVNPRPQKQCYEAHISGFKKTAKIMEMLDIPAGSRQKAKMSNSHYTNSLRGFVAGFFDAEGHVDANNNAIVISCANEHYIDFFRYALLTEGITSRKYESRAHNSRWYRLYIYGIDQVEKFYKTYPVKFPEKIRKIEELLGRGKESNTNTDTIECNGTIIKLLKTAKKEKGYSNSEIARMAGLTQGAISFYKRRERTPSRRAVGALAKAFESAGIESSKLKLLAESDIFWDKVIAIHSYPYNGFVYDLTVSEERQTGRNPHNFVAQGIIVGNSLGTVHANSAQETIVRVTNPPMNVPQVMLSGLDIIVVQHRLHDRKMGTIRRITEIAQVTGALEGKPKTEAVYLRDPVTDSLKRTKAQINYAQKLQELAGMSKKDFDDEVKDRAAYLEKLVKENRRSMKEISEAVKQYSMKKK
ncbi:MAG: ATPase, T2SS/T4P/T4SS family [archaeon]